MKHYDQSGQLNRRERRAVAANTTTEAERRALANAVAASKHFDREAFLRRFWQMDAALVAAGFHATSPKWRADIARFVRSGRRRWLIRAGRRSGKSSTLCRLGVAWAWFGPWHVPLGDIAVLAFVSVSKDESASRLRTIAAILDALGLSYEQRAEEIELGGSRPAVFKTFAATVRAVVGFTSVAVFGDEVAMWESRESAANPAPEVFGFLLPTLATQPYGFAVLSSAPWGLDDFHAELFEQGDTEHQIASFGATWDYNPTITEEQTYALEPNEQRRQQAYGAVPGETVSVALDRADVAACFGRRPTGKPGAGFVSTDASSLVGGDDFAWSAGFQTSLREVVVEEIGAWAGEAQRAVSLADIASVLASKARVFGAPCVYGDQRESAGLDTCLRQVGVSFISYDWSLESKDSAVQLLRRLMREGQLCLPEHVQLRGELTSLRARLLPSGLTRYETNGLDYASTLITLMHAILAGDAPHTAPDLRVGHASRSAIERRQTISGRASSRRHRL